MPNRPRILAIDDVPFNLAVFARALAREYDVRIAASGEEGLAIAATEVPNLILLDVLMPEMDGFETCRRFKADPALRDIPIIFVTAATDNTSELSGFALGACDYLIKPINIPIARARMRNLLERELLRRQNDAYRHQLETMVAERTQALSETNARLETALVAADAANRAKSTFLASVSHELRTPLNAIQGVTRQLSQSLPDPSSRQQLARIDTASRQLLGIFEAMLTVSRLEGNDARKNQCEDFSLREFIEHALWSHRADARSKGLTLTPAIDDALPPHLRGMAGGIQQVLGNFLGNAVKFSTRGEIQLRVAPAQNAGETPVRVRFEVRDEGPGIAERDLAALFTPFAQLDNGLNRQHGGLGLGLATSRHLATLMGGQVGVRSTPGQGSCFWLEVPLMPAHNPPVPTHSPRPAPSTEPPLPAATPCQPALGDPATEAILRQLAALLAVDDIEAMTLWNQHRDSLTMLLGPAAAGVEDALNGFDFETAAQLLKTRPTGPPEDST